MSYRPPQESYYRYQMLRWWCQNQWWVQIAAPCVICIGVISALLYHWNNERNAEMQDKIGQMQYEHWKNNPPILDDELNERTAAWRVIRLKQGDPSMPIPYKKKQLIVKHWNELIVDMRPEEVQRLHDLLQDKPANPQDETEIDIRKFDAPWQDSVTVDGMESNTSNPVKPLPEDQPAEPSEGETPASDTNSAPALNPSNSPTLPSETALPIENTSDEKDVSATDNPISDSVALPTDTVLPIDNTSDEKDVSATDNSISNSATLPTDTAAVLPVLPTNTEVPESQSAFQQESIPVEPENSSVLLPTDINAPVANASHDVANSSLSVTQDEQLLVDLPTIENPVLPTIEDIVLPTIDGTASPSDNTVAASDNANSLLPVLGSPSNTKATKNNAKKPTDNSTSAKQTNTSSKKIAGTKDKKDPKSYLPSGWKKNPIIL